MYLKEFVQRLIGKPNVPTLIYLILNVYIIGAVIVAGWFDLSIGPGLVLGIVLYILSLAIALSPFGEWLLRYTTGCKPLEDQPGTAMLIPLFNTVYAQAKEANPSIPGDVQLYINEDEFPNAFATGRKTICITRGFLTKSPEEIKAVLAHEFGHLAHKDTDIVLFVGVGNLIVMFAVAMFRAVFFGLYKLAHWSYYNSNNVNGYKMADNTTHLYNFFTAIIAAIMWVWTKIGVLLVMKSSRDNEFEADYFAHQLGYGAALCSVLSTFASSGAKGLFASLMSSHPDSTVRIERLKSL